MNGSEVTFTNDRVFIDNIEIGVLQNKVYTLKRPDIEAFSADDEVFMDDGHTEGDMPVSSGVSVRDSLKLELLHKRFAHTNIAGIKELIKCESCDGLNNITHQQSSPNTFHCEACAMAKLTTKSRDPSKKLRRQLTAVNKELYFHVVYSDVLGPMQVRSASGH